jgi:DNA-binding response OmpR family regulator
LKIDTKKILIVEDYEGILLPIQIALEMEGFEVIPTIDGSEVFQKILTESPDLLLMDVFLSGMDGRNITCELKQNMFTSDLPIILMSANGKLKKEASDSGADDFIEKPFEINELIDKIKRLLYKEVNNP